MFSNGGFPSPETLARPRSELVELLKAWLGTTLAFALVFRGAPSFVRVLLIMAITAGLGIVLHELAHRAVARHFGSDAYFMANDLMLVASILIAYGTGFLIAAPGAVWHQGFVTRRQSGLIAAAGPATNVALAVLFLITLLVFRSVGQRFFFELSYYGYIINSLLALFNMIPLGPIDGAKILDWDVKAFAGLGAASGLLFLLPRMAPDLFAFGF